MDFATIERTSTLTSEEKQFLADLSDKSKILETFSDRIYRCPAMEPNGIWQIRILDPEKYYHSQEASVDFVLADPEVEKEHKEFQCSIDKAYTFLKGCVPLGLGRMTVIKDDAAAIVYLQGYGFRRCVVHTIDPDETISGPEDRAVFVSVIDEDFTAFVPIINVYPCLKEFGDTKVKRNGLVLDHLFDYYSVEEYRKQLLNFFKNNTQEIFDAEVKAITETDIAVCNLFTKDNPPLYVNQYIWANVASSLRHSPFPEVGGIMTEVFVTNAEATGQLYITQNKVSNFFYQRKRNSLRDEDIEKIIAGSGPFELNKSTIYLAKYIDDVYYRARLVELPLMKDSVLPTLKVWNLEIADPKTQILVKFIDYGNHALVSPQEMVPAEFVDPIVGKFIPQARKVRWANTRRINVQEFRSILADTTKVDLQVVGYSKKLVPEVEIIFSDENNPNPRHLPARLRVQTKSTNPPIPCYASEKQCATLYQYRSDVWSLPTMPPSPPLVLRPNIAILVTLSKLVDSNEFLIERCEGLQNWEIMNKRISQFNRMIGNQVETKPYCLMESRMYLLNLNFGENYDENLYHRVILAEEEKNRKLKVYLVDSGKCELVDRVQLLDFPPEHRLLPSKLFAAKLHNVGNFWTAAQKQHFITTLRELIFWFRIRDIRYDLYDQPILEGEIYNLAAANQTDRKKDCLQSPDTELRGAPLSYAELTGISPG